MTDFGTISRDGDMRGVITALEPRYAALAEKAGAR
jgi:hypothetical protein